MKISHYILSYLRLDKRIFCPRYDGVYYAYTFGSNDFGKFDHFIRCTVKPRPLGLGYKVQIV